METQLYTSADRALTGDYVGKPEKKRLILGIGPKKKERQKEKFTMKYAGRYYFYVTEARVYDVIRLFSKKVSVRDDNVFVNVLPTIREIPVEVDPRTRQHMPDSDEYATDRKGEDVSEIYAIREYRPGDSMKTIHWKLSARMDHWMVKEFSFPQGVQVLLLLDLYTASSKNFREEEMDALLGNFSSLSYSLAGKENKKQRKKWYLFSKNTLCQRIFLEDYYENR